MDWSGAFFSLLALGKLDLPDPLTPIIDWCVTDTAPPPPVVQNTFDVLGGVLYIIW